MVCALLSASYSCEKSIAICILCRLPLSSASKWYRRRPAVTTTDTRAADRGISNGSRQVVPAPEVSMQRRLQASSAAEPVRGPSGSLLESKGTDLMKHRNFFIFEGERFKQFLFRLAAIEVVPIPRLNQHVQHCLLFVWVRAEVLRICLKTNCNQ